MATSRKNKKSRDSAGTEDVSLATLLASLTLLDELDDSKDPADIQLRELKDSFLLGLERQILVLIHTSEDFTPRLFVVRRNSAESPPAWQPEHIEAAHPAFYAEPSRQLESRMLDLLKTSRDPEPTSSPAAVAWACPFGLGDSSIVAAVFLRTQDERLTVFLLSGEKLLRLPVPQKLAMLTFEMAVTATAKLTEDSITSILKRLAKNVYEAKAPILERLVDKGLTPGVITEGIWRELVSSLFTVKPVVESLEQALQRLLTYGAAESSNCAQHLDALAQHVLQLKTEHASDLERASEVARDKTIRNLQSAVTTADTLLKGATQRANRLELQLRDAKVAALQPLAQSGPNPTPAMSVNAALGALFSRLETHQQQ